MKERPILLSATMVRAILDGRKTQTRLVLKCWERYADWSHAQPALPDFREELPGADESSWLLQKEKGPLIDMLWQPVGCPYGKPGDRLWVRETSYEKGEWIIPGWDGAEAEDAYWSGTGKYLYAATDEKPERGYRTWPSIHMKRKASRILLEIVSVRVERLQDISEADAKEEGSSELLCKGFTHKHGFELIWESINGAGRWQANPWVWVIEFKVVTQ